MNLTGTKEQIKTVIDNLGMQMTLVNAENKKSKLIVLILTEKNEDLSALSSSGSTSQLKTVGYCVPNSKTIINNGDILTSKELTYTIASVEKFRINNIDLAIKLELIG